MISTPRPKTPGNEPLAPGARFVAVSGPTWLTSMGDAMVGGVMTTMVGSGSNLAEQANSRPQLAAFEEELDALLADFHSVRQRLQALRASTFGDCPNSDPPQPPSGTVAPVPNGATFLWHGRREVPGGSVPRLIGTLVAGATTARLMDEWEA